MQRGQKTHREVLTAGLGGVKVTLNRHADATTAHKQTGVRSMPPLWNVLRGASEQASRQKRTARRGHDAGGADSSLQSEGRRVRKSRGVGTVADQGEQNARIRDTPSSASRIGDGEPESRRPQARSAGKRQKRTWHALQQADVEVHPAGGAAARVNGSRGGGGAAGRRPAATHSSHSTVTPSIFLNGRAADVCHSCGLRRIRLLSVSRMRLFWP